MKRIAFTTSTFPASDNDPVPAFIKDEAVWLKKLYSQLQIDVIAPHNAYSQTKSFSRHKYYDEYRFHYFWPFRWEKLAGRGIMPALKQNKLLYFELPFLFLGEFFALWKYVRKNKPDLIYAHWFTPQAITGAMVSKFTGVPLVFDTQASDVIVLKKFPFSKKIVAAVCNRAYAYTAPSQMTVDKLLYFTTPANRDRIMEKLHLIPLGTTLPKTTEAAIQRAMEKYNLKNKKMIYFIGRLVERKGANILIQAFSQLSKDDLSLRLIIVGDGQERLKLEGLAEELGVKDKVIFTGFLAGEERFALLNLASVAAVPSVNVGDQAEGLPIVFMEAISCRKPVVLTDATGAHEVVKDGHNAYIAKAGSVDDLRKNLKKALEVRDKVFFRAVEELSDEFQWPNIARRRAEVFKLNGS